MYKDVIVEISREVTNAIVRFSNVQEILNYSTDIICKKLNVEVCSILGVDRQEDCLRLIASAGIEFKDFTLQRGEGIAWLSYENLENMNVANPAQHPSYKALDTENESRYQAFLSVPMVIAGKCVGVFCLFSSIPKPFVDDVVELAESIAAQLSVVVGNSNVENIFKDHSQADKTTHEESVLTAESLTGIGITDSMAHGPVWILDTDETWDLIEERPCTDKAVELHRLQEALESAKEETIDIQDRASKIFIEADASIFFAQLLFLEDPNFISDIENGINAFGLEAVSSVKKTVDKYIAKFRKTNDPQLIERTADLKDVGNRLIHSLNGYCWKSNGEEETTNKVILVGKELMPSDLMRISPDKLLGIVCSKGGSTSHAAILARSMKIPAVMGVENFDKICKDGDFVLVNALDGKVYVNPEDDFVAQQQELFTSTATVDVTELMNKEAHTACGHRVNIKGNVCMLSDVAQLNEFQHDGVGLYRTEFMFMIHDNLPSENEQYRVFRRLRKIVDNKPLTIRILDIGGDKPVKYIDMPNESDPMLGWRSIRFLLERPEIFEPHLRAMLRAAQRGNIQLLFPMITNYEDIINLKLFFDKTMVKLKEHYGNNFVRPKIGAMLETPSALWQLDEILKEVDFVSVGTNDLIQYTFAVDRGNSKVSDYYKPFHPVIIKSLKKIADKCKVHKTPVSVCGEVAGDPLYTPILLGLGLDELSMPPAMVNKVKPVVNAVKFRECRRLVKSLLKLPTEHEVLEELHKFFDSKELKY